MSQTQKPIPLTIPPYLSLSPSQLQSHKPYRTWLSTLQHSLSLQSSDPSHAFHKDPYELKKIEVQAVDFFGGERIGFIKLKAEIKNSNGEKLPGSVFLRGGSVGMMVTLQPNDIPSPSEKDKYVLLTVQPRIPAGSMAMTELPAGMIDDGTFAGAAAKEIQEELGLEIEESAMTELTAMAISSSDSESHERERLQNGVYPSAGGSDEYIPLFLYEKRVDRKDLEGWEGKLTGLREQGEKITLRLVRLEDLWKLGARDAKSLSAWALYKGLKDTGKL